MVSFGMMPDEIRADVASRYIAGRGIEIGALHKPLRLPIWADVRYLDRMSEADLRKQYPELSSWPLVDVDIIDDGESFGSIADDTLDFVVANHFIEHTEDPIGALTNMLRTLSDGGVAYIAVPDRTRTFDRNRPATAIGHLIEDHRDGGSMSRSAHYAEWSRLVALAPDPDAEAARLMSMSYSIHFHVWSPDEFIAFLSHARCALGLPFDTEIAIRNEDEIITVLRKARPGGQAVPPPAARSSIPKPDADELLASGEALFEEGRADEAILLFKRIVNAEPRNHIAWNDLGVALTSLGRTTDAGGCFIKAIAIKGDYQEALDNLRAI